MLVSFLKEIDNGDREREREKKDYRKVSSHDLSLSNLLNMVRAYQGTFSILALA